MTTTSALRGLPAGLKLLAGGGEHLALVFSDLRCTQPRQRPSGVTIWYCSLGKKLPVSYILLSLIKTHIHPVAFFTTIYSDVRQIHKPLACRQARILFERGRLTRREMAQIPSTR